MMGEDRRLAAFEGAFRSFTGCIGDLPGERFLAAMENGSPRDLVARLIGWNRLAILGCKAILDAHPPAYHPDFVRGYQRVNAELIAREPSSDKNALLETLEKTKTEAVAYLQAVPADAWNADHGVRHPDGGPATVRRCLEELTRDYLDATDEITIWREAPAKS
jgi:hypothetical protein